ncbi:hypothetical protein KIN20_007067 [Parelaphostrongylus tenuis]|uniref:Uncharacterized protein n=1 Tax=Parelaphostrongylus tenuis TaxID=148309 RepID=A0AAD5QJR4_PARTN|nr:hypothetical protein KIN20_007067 [Parelaphostrongylus tenuis]
MKISHDSANRQLLAVTDCGENTAERKPSPIHKKHRDQEEVLEAVKQKLEKEKPKIDDLLIPQVQHPSTSAKAEEMKKPVVDSKEVISKSLPPEPKEPEQQVVKSWLTYPPTSPKSEELKKTAPLQQKKELKQTTGEIYGIRPEKPDVAPSTLVKQQSLALQPTQREAPTFVKQVSPTLQPTQREDVVLSSQMKTTVRISPPKESMASQLSRQPLRHFDTVQMPQASTETRPSFPPISTSMQPPAPAPQSDQRPSSSVQVELPPPQAPSAPPGTLQQSASSNLRVNIDEILRLGAIMERKGLTPDKKMSFEWIALNRHVVHQQPEAFAAHLVTAVGDVRIEKSLACDALNVLMYQRTISPDEYLRLCQQLNSSQPITISYLAQLLRTNTQFYSSPRNIQPVLGEQRY